MSGPRADVATRCDTPSATETEADIATNAKPDDSTDDRRAGDVPRPRNCLRCRARFESAWSGERICPRCKGTASWRNGQPMGG